MKSAKGKTLLQLSEAIPAEGLKGVILFVIRLPGATGSEEGLFALRRRTTSLVDLVADKDRYDAILS